MTFIKEYYFLSNFYPVEVEFDGIRYPSSEAAYQAQKSLDPSVRAKFAEYRADIAKKEGQKVKLRPDWDSVRVGIMEAIVKAKFAQHPDLAEKLINTGSMHLEEGNRWGDIFWGVDKKTGVGENNLGKILMKVREELRQASKGNG